MCLWCSFASSFRYYAWKKKHVEKLGPTWLLELAFPQNRNIYLGYLCKSSPRHGQILLQAVQTAESSLPMHKCWMKWSSLLCRVEQDVLSHFAITNGLFFQGKKKKRYKFLNTQTGCCQWGGWYQVLLGSFPFRSTRGRPGLLQIQVAGKKTTHDASL